MLGLCFLEKGMPQLAIKWFRKGLETAGDRGRGDRRNALRPRDGLPGHGRHELAYQTFQEVFGLNANYRDVVQRVRDLEAVRKNS